MFGKEKTRESETQLPVVRTSSKDVKTLISEGCKVEGNFFVPTTTRIDGIIKGDLTGENGIVIGGTGRVEGNICAADVIVYGTIKGNIESDRLELKRGCDMLGDISSNNLITEQGAVFNGKCTMKTADENVTELQQVGQSGQ